MSTPFPPSSPAHARAPQCSTRTRQTRPQPAKALAAAALWTIALSAAPLHALAAETAPGELGLPHLHADPPRTVAVWLFDEPPGLYPSAVIGDVGPDDVLMVIGPGGRITPGGRFGNALQVLAEPALPEIPEGEFPAHFGLVELPVPDGRTAEPMNWFNAGFAALITSGETHLRKQLGFVRPTAGGLNLGDADWTVEFWLRVERPAGDGGGTVFEIGSGPRGENDRVTRLRLAGSHDRFILENHASGAVLEIPSSAPALRPGSADSDWNHFAFTYHARERQVRHYVDGVPQPLPGKVRLKPLPEGEEDYFAVGTDGRWGAPLPGSLDELRFSTGVVYEGAFGATASLAGEYLESFPAPDTPPGAPLLFTSERMRDEVVELGSRKYLFVDGAIADSLANIEFRMNPPRLDRIVMEVEGVDEGTPGYSQPFRKHLTVLEDEQGRIRIYNALDDDYLGVWISEDGVNFEAPETGIRHAAARNIVIPDQVGIGTVVLDPNAPPASRWRYIADYRRRGMYVYTSPDGFRFTRHLQMVAPFRSGSQPDVYYDDQKGLYTGFHRSDFYRTPAGETVRTFVMTEMDDLMSPWPFTPATAADYVQTDPDRIMNPLSPWYLDNGPLTPGGWGVEYPPVFGPDYDLDPESTAGIYNPKAIKYPWAPDTYLAFPVHYLYYYEGPPGQKVLSVRRGGGPTETQFAASRDGVEWNRFPRPVYVGMGEVDGIYFTQSFIAQGMVRRGDEIWQYVFLDEDYHSPHERTYRRRVARLIQRFDGFVSADAPYGRDGVILTRPIRFDGDRLEFNIKTDAMGSAFVELLDEAGAPIPGFTLEESVMINGDHMNVQAEWITAGIDELKTVPHYEGMAQRELHTSADLSSLRGRTIRVRLVMRGASLYSMQFRESGASD